AHGGVAAAGKGSGEGERRHGGSPPAWSSAGAGARSITRHVGHGDRRVRRPNSRARSEVPAGARWPRMRTRKGGIMVSVATKHPNGSPAFSSDPGRWAAVVRRDRRADGVFYYSVRTTGVYCRPSCAARLARRENVRFHATCADAERAGFRPCKRCRPDSHGLVEARAEAVARACRLIETAEEVPSLDALADAAGLSRFHFHRVFKTTTGLTPKAYAAAHRARRVRDELSRSDSATDAIYGSGFHSSGRSYAAAPEVGFGEAPALGLDLPLDVRGTAFQQRVWQALREIPAGATSTYTKIAARIGAPKAVRAVARACASNTLAVAIPCHRVVRHDGGLSGYRWGVKRKRLLLEREAVS